MAGKKPAKAISGQSKNTTLDPAVYGVRTMFIGTKGSPSFCNNCNRKTVRGMVLVKNDAIYCSTGCSSSSN